MTVLDKDELDDLRLLCKGGWAICEIADYFGIRAETAVREIEAHGIEYKGPRETTASNRRKTQDCTPQMLELWDAGLDTGAIGERLGLSRSVVANALRKAGRDLSVMRRRYDGRGGVMKSSNRAAAGILNEG